MKLNSKIGTLLVLMFLVTGCIGDKFNGGPVVIGNEIEFDLSAQLPGLNSQSPATYAMGDAAERQVNTLDLLLFTESGGNEIFDRVVAIDMSTVKNSVANANVKTFKTRLPKSATTKYRLVLMANFRDQLTETAIAGFANKTKQEVVNKFEFSSAGKWNATSSSNYTPFILWGESENTTTITTSTVFTMIDLLRPVARIDIGVNIDANNVAQGLGVSGNLFKVSKVMVCNSYDKGFIAPSAANYGLRTVSNPTIPNNPEPGINSRDHMTYTLSAPAISYAGEIYVSEYDNKNKGLADAFCLLVAGRYDGSNTDSWYRIDFKNAENANIDILRNHRYVVNITDIKGPGAADPDEAFYGLLSLSAYVIPWNEAVVNAHPEGLYTLDVSKRSFTFDFLPRTPGYDDNKVVITTDYAAGWSISAISSSEWLSTSMIYGPANTPTALSIITTINDTDAVRVGFIYVSAGHWTYKITVTQGILQTESVYSSNCYIVKPNTNPLLFKGILIPVSRANTTTELGINHITAAAAITGNLVWVDQTNGVQYASEKTDAGIAYITSVGTGATGQILVVPGRKACNAVVDVKVKVDVKWSWHIWCTDYNPTTSTTTLYNDEGQRPLQSMDRHLGAYAADFTGLSGYWQTGLFYQWGRKDPFVGAAGWSGTAFTPIYNEKGVLISIQDGTNAGSLSNSVANPLTFYARTAVPNNWSGTTLHNDQLWASSKTVYDPCPLGWKVPEGTSLSDLGNAFSPWNGLNNTNFAWSATPHLHRAGVKVGMYPASGHIAFLGAFLANVASSSATTLVWSASASVSGGEHSGKSHVFSFTDSDVQAVGNAQRALGLPVRCVKELAR